MLILLPLRTFPHQNAESSDSRHSRLAKSPLGLGALMKGLSVVSVPVETNQQLRESRLISSIPGYLMRSIFTILCIFLIYQPLRVFSLLVQLVLIDN